MGSRKYADRLREMETPLYFYDMGLLQRTLDAVVAESSKYGFRVHYALKANFDERILRTIAGAGLGADCVSGNEVRQAIKCGIHASEVVFAGVGKSDKEIAYALEQDIFAFNVESRNELEVLDELAAKAGKKARVAFRINPDVDARTHKNISTGKADNKFGIPYDEVDEVIAEMGKFKNVEIVGIHFHIGSQITDMTVFETLVLRVNDIAAWFESNGIELKHINLGGGLGINYDDPDGEPIPDFAGYFSIFAEHLVVRPEQTVHFELGRSIVGQCGDLVTKVLYNKKTAAGTNVIIVDAGMNDLIRPALYGARHVVENLSAAVPRCEENGEKNRDGNCKKYTVGGPICESSDIFARDILLPETKRGDLLALRSAGAYGYAMVSHYNMRDVPQVVYSDEL